MQFGMISLGRAGGDMVGRLVKDAHSCAVFDLDSAKVSELASEGAAGLEKFLQSLETPRATWMMLPAGGPTEQMLPKIAAHLKRGDIALDGGNSCYKGGVRRAETLARAMRYKFGGHVERVGPKQK